MGMPASANDYATLGLRPAATPGEVESRFQELALQNHPHRNPDPRAGQRFQAIVTAYERIRESGGGRVYRVGEEQPEDREDRRSALPQQLVPFEQAVWQPAEIRPTLWTQLRFPAFCIQAAVATILLVLGGRFLLTYAGDASAVSALARAPLCSAKLSPDCIGVVGATVDATTTNPQTPLFGGFSEGVKIQLSGQELDVAVGRPDGASDVAYGGLDAPSLTTVQRWHGQIVGVDSPDGTLPTDNSPSEIRSLHLRDAIGWATIALLLAIRPAMILPTLIKARRASGSTDDTA